MAVASSIIAAGIIAGAATGTELIIAHNAADTAKDIAAQQAAAAQQAGNQQNQGIQAAIDLAREELQNRQLNFEQQQRNLQPFLTAGANSLGALMAGMGMGAGGGTNLGRPAGGSGAYGAVPGMTVGTLGGLYTDLSMNTPPAAPQLPMAPSPGTSGSGGNAPGSASAPAQPPTQTQSNEPTVPMRSPDGQSLQSVPLSQVEWYESRGAQRVA